ncbi:hypothetical protein C8Q78DRAFT_1124620 [Trametes maxima]|nr:hypothetical protein C8Q78DRAFT_1124620 [Trametes maxima]
MWSKSLTMAFTTAALTACALGSGPLIIDTPTLVRQCENTKILWQGGAGPFELAISKTGSAIPTDVFVDIPAGSSSLVWKVNIAAGTSVSLMIEDSAGSLGLSAPFVIQPGGCLWAFTRSGLGRVQHSIMRFNSLALVTSTVIGVHARPQDPILPLTPVVRNGEVIEQFSDIPAAPVNFVEGIFLWDTNVAAGTEVRMIVSDSTGAVAPTGLFTIMLGACILFMILVKNTYHILEEM